MFQNWMEPLEPEVLDEQAASPRAARPPPTPATNALREIDVVRVGIGVPFPAAALPCDLRFAAKLRNLSHCFA